MEKTFEGINSNAAGNVNSLISVTISTDNTIVWYDHHEDGYEEDAKNPSKGTTEVWGDGDSGNGCAPTVSSCTDANDVLEAGDVIILDTDVVLVKSGSSYTRKTGVTPMNYDGGDRVQSSFPIAITRGAYPDTPGSLMAGGVEVLDTSKWGTTFVAPVGQNTFNYNRYNPFQLVQFYVMAGEDNTTVTYPGGEQTINTGKTIQFSVNEGAEVTSDKPVQVDLLTGDIASTYALRWFSLLPIEDWSSSYVAPVGDTKGETKVRLYNPTDSSLSIRVQTRWDDYYVSVSSKSSEYTKVIPDQTGAKVTASENFLALSLTDTEGNGKSIVPV
jgi:hypothetical protein